MMSNVETLSVPMLFTVQWRRQPKEAAQKFALGACTGPLFGVKSIVKKKRTSQIYLGGQKRNS